ncbi:hypothetical protein ATL39_1290 [Sinobaca qinghaiensis]|uniref:DUF4015 domain-containing protein n=1 Tax=Sinobaca qinghaiensis TaxID=342944 RepID=A0A419V6J8_9BACL|nr:putative glycoside hydrolase [Sinobaca qinghaiensis]RKD75589.1 hypothetical protein ATL39_1290 [Sinobaca qinghaiensis]
MKRTVFKAGTVLVLGGLAALQTIQPVQAEEQAGAHPHKELGNMELQFEGSSRFLYNTGYNFEYPDAVRGVYVTANSIVGEKSTGLYDLLETTDLNSMVIDIKDDFGNLTFMPPEDSDLPEIGVNTIADPEAMMKQLEEHEVYPIARVVVFKDTELAEARPDLSFTENGEVWKNSRGEAFVNPYEKEVWDYNVKIAEEAAKLGFKEIQFDYVRFPEGFETRDEALEYSRGDFGDEGTNTEQRVNAVNSFVEYAREELQGKYDVEVSVDIFGNSAVVGTEPGIGQSFTGISENVDVISSMIYPSHWGPGSFDIDKPDLHPYELTKEYAVLENEVLGGLENPPVTRPWIQDFTASYLGAGNYISYGDHEVEEQIRALNEQGIDEYLLWDAGNNYSANADYTPIND